MEAGEVIGRRTLLRRAGAGALWSAATGLAAQPRVRLGLVGCGGRGRYVAGIMVEAGAQVVAMADLFADRIASAKAHVDAILQQQGLPPVAADRLYRGPDSPARLAHSDLDAILIAITPHYYPQVLATVAEAGKHIYCEKPVATDVAGCHKVVEIGRKVDGKITFHVGLQLRYAPSLQELVRRVHAGAIGDIVAGEAYFYYYGGNRQTPKGVGPDEARLRTWGGDRVLSGDIIVEQNVHSIDKVNWVMRGHPIAVEATGGRGVRSDAGDVWDHFEAILHYPRNVPISFRSTQFLKGWSDVGERFFGAKGVTEAHYEGPVRILGANPWDAGVKGTRTGTEAAKAQAFLEDIRTGKLRNESFQGAESTLSAILVRTAAYSARTATWDEVVSSNAKWDANIDLRQFA
jgi:predicted dehydrogenase